ncbi:MAG: hypothetical protein DMF45_10920 [Verrucomicrobia bacterium]|nr:MAG: hypothetical protein DMF45_10920 [Verrucomicrobiota bacterium]
MSMEEGKQALFQRELSKLEVVAGLRRALDLQYRLLCQAARADWERLFGSKDPADACVSVRVASQQIAIQTTAIRGSGFLKSRRQPVSKPGAKDSLPRFAH